MILFVYIIVLRSYGEGNLQLLICTYDHLLLDFLKENVSISLSSYSNLSELYSKNCSVCFLLKQVGHIPKSANSPADGSLILFHPYFNLYKSEFVACNFLLRKYPCNSRQSRNHTSYNLETCYEFFLHYHEAVCVH